MKKWNRFLLAGLAGVSGCEPEITNGEPEEDFSNAQ
jgi:hypothetical protein